MNPSFAPDLPLSECELRSTNSTSVTLQEAARCRDELKKLQPEKKAKPPLSPPPPTQSDSLTNGVRVQVKRWLSPMCDIDDSHQQINSSISIINSVLQLPHPIRLHASSVTQVKQHLDHSQETDTKLMPSSFLPYRSRPGQYVFMYRIRIVNESAQGAVKLQRRHWIITDANSYQDQVR